MVVMEWEGGGGGGSKEQPDMRKGGVTTNTIDMQVEIAWIKEEEQLELAKQKKRREAGKSKVRFHGFEQ